MRSELSFRLHETQRFLKAIVFSVEGRRFLVSHLISTLLLTLILVASFIAVILTLHEGFHIRRRTVVLSFSILFFSLSIVPMLTMPFFSFKDITNKISHFLFKNNFFTNLSSHVFYHQSRNGQITLHLAKAHSVLAEKYRLIKKQKIKKDSMDKHRISRDLALSIAKSIRDAVRLSKEYVQAGRLKTDQVIVGATYGYLFGTAKSKLKLNRIEPGWFKRYIGNIFYRFGALHAVFMYFVINDKLPPSFDTVYFNARVGDVIGLPSPDSTQGS
ncbi:hypothetical protein [Thiomicrospira microaerophila]|uniref:hypothetical protein n=1 Tax=Thiomicrospira microaerophila TaxID=406020 RepID=UPI0005C8776E|nr:hypothetical protein [Thiomicrospira microaerophila]